MPAIRYGRLAAASMALTLALIAQSAPTIMAKSLRAIESQSLSTANSTVSMLSPSSLFSLPTRIDDYEILEEYGRFMTAAMNQSIDPCEDFYEYSCGNWKHSEMVPQLSRNDTFLHAIQNQVDQMLEKFLQNITQEEIKSNSAESKAKVFFSSCQQMYKQMDKGYKEIGELKEFTRELKASSENETFDWININFLSPYGMYPLLPLKVHYETETRKFDLSIGPPPLVLAVPSILSVTNLTRDLKIEDEQLKRNFTDELDLMIKFEKNLSAHASSRNETEILRLSEFLQRHEKDSFNWTRYFDVAFNGTQKSEWTIRYSIEDIRPLVKFLNKTDLETMRDYVKWRTLLKFYYIWKFETKDKLAESTCREHTEQYFNYALIPWFIRNVYDADRRADVLHVAKHIKDTFYNLIDKYSWLDDVTKSNAKTKLSSMDIQVGYSDDMRHSKIIDQVYSEVNVTEVDWFKNLFVMEANRAKVRMRSVDKAIIPPLMSTRDVNAYYADFLNLVFIAIGITQLPFYHIKFPASLKFGGIGNIIGHEMAHGFDSYCYQFDYDGKKTNWWTEGSLRNFRERYRCLESQYNKFIYRGVATNGTLTSGDNIADNVGARIAYYAYMKSHGNKNGDHRPIPGVKFTNKQLFFLKFAQTWCTGRDDASKVKKIKTDVHSYEEFRVVGTVSNMPEFSEVFKCKLGSDMNPLRKCVVW